MQMLRMIVVVLSAGLLIVAAHEVAGQAYPSKPIQIVVSEPGGGSDLAARLIGAIISPRLGQPIVIENRQTFIGTLAVAKAAPDGYTLLINGQIVWVMPLLQTAAQWDAIRDFAPITLVTVAPLVLMVHPSLPVNTVSELIALAKANPGKLNYSTTGPGTPPQFAAELLKAMAGVNIVQVNYKSTALALNAIIAGEIDVNFANVVPAVTQMKSGKLRALAVTTAKPSPLFPGLPAVAASGLPGYESAAIIGMYAPGRTPDAIISQLNEEVVRALEDTTLKEKLRATGTEVVSSSPEQLAATMKADMARVEKVIKMQGIHID